MQETFLKGRCFDKKGAITAHVELDVGGTVVTAAITNGSVYDLKLTVGEEAAVIKSSDVIFAVKD